MNGKKRFEKESDVQAAICDYLALRKVFFIRLNNIPATFIDRNGNRQFRSLGKYARKGLSDILAVKAGKAYFIEVKREGGRMSLEQHDFMRDVVLAGAEYVLAKSIDDVQSAGL